MWILYRIGTIFLLIAATLITTIFLKNDLLKLVAERSSNEHSDEKKVLYRVLLRSDLSKITDQELQQQILELVSSDREFDMLRLSLKFRLFRKIQKLYEVKDQLNSFEGQVSQVLQQSLFPFLSGRPFSQQYEQLTGSGRGIVLTVGQRLFPSAVHLMRSLRDIWNCTMPVELFYNGPLDLREESVEYLRENFKNVKVIDISLIYNTTELELGGWDLKPFSILASSFRQVLLVDADVVFAQNPSVLFEYQQFTRSGTLFFRDRPLKISRFNYYGWIKAMIPEPLSQTLLKNEMFRGTIHHYQESGVVLLDKGRRIFGLLGACLLNLPGAKGYLHRGSYCEKESFWIGFEIAEEPYEFNYSNVGNIGMLKRTPRSHQDYICGHPAQFDDEDSLIWFNDGIIKDKFKNDTSLGIFTSISNEGDWVGICLLVDGELSLSEQQNLIIDKIRDIWNENPLAMAIY